MVARTQSESDSFFSEAVPENETALVLSLDNPLPPVVMNHP